MYGVAPLKRHSLEHHERKLNMTLALLFWVIAIVAIVFGAWGYTNPQASRWAPWPVFILVLILGFAEFGFRLTR